MWFRVRQSHLIRPYLWTKRKSGKLQMRVKTGDLVFVHKVNRIGQVTYIGRNQLKVYYKDPTGASHEEWYPKSTLALLATGNQLTNQNLPEGSDREVTFIRPEKGGNASEHEKVPGRVLMV